MLAPAPPTLTYCLLAADYRVPGFLCFVLGQADPKGLDLLKKLLVLNPDKRLTTAEALRHPYFAPYRKEESEIMSFVEVKTPFDDNQRLKIHEYRTKLYNDIVDRRRQAGGFLGASGLAR